MPDDVFDTVIKMAHLAVNENENESNTSAQMACKLIREHEAVFRERPRALSTSEGSVHPDTRIHFEVEKRIYAGSLQRGRAGTDARCAACAGRIVENTLCYFQEHVTTHARDECKAWWIDGKPVTDPPAEEISAMVGHLTILPDVGRISMLTVREGTELDMLARCRSPKIEPVTSNW